MPTRTLLSSPWWNVKIFLKSGLRTGSPHQLRAASRQPAAGVPWWNQGECATMHAMWTRPAAPGASALRLAELYAKALDTLG